MKLILWTRLIFLILVVKQRKTLKRRSDLRHTGGSPGELSEELVTQKKGWRMNCDVCEATEGLENEL